jgi:hypothetical protein
MVRKDERPELNAYGEGFGLKEWSGAEFGVVGNLDVFGSEAAGEEREAEVANGDLAAESFSKLRLDGGAKALCVDEEGNQENSEDQNGGDRDCNLHPGFFHGDAP